MTSAHQPRSSRTGAPAEGVVVERSFVVDGTPAESWRRLALLTAEHDSGPGSWWLPGFRCRATEIEATPERRLEVTKNEEPCRGTTIVLALEHVGTGTRIQVTQSGFDPTFVERAGDDFWRHAALLLDEIEAFFRGRTAPATA